MAIVFLGTQVGLPPMEDDTDLRDFTAQPGGGSLHVRVLGRGSADLLDHASIEASRRDASLAAPVLGAPPEGATFALRDYQQEAVKAVFDSWKRGTRAPLVCLPTGCGKTLIAASVMQRAAARRRRSLFIAHRKELIDQTAQKIALTSRGDPPPSVGIVQASRNQLGCDITVASTGTLRGKRLQEALSYGPYDVIFIDEAHHAPSKTYQKILHAATTQNPNARICGLPATPARSDGLALDLVFDEVCYQKTIFEMIDAGWLVPFKGYRPHFNVQFGDVGTASNGDYDKKQLSKVLNTPHVNRTMVHSWCKYGHDRKTILFAVDVEHAHALTREFEAAGYPAGCVTGKTKKRERTKLFKQFGDGSLKVLVNVEVATEGYDEPSIEAVMFARPTQSQGLFIQMLGRGLRLHPGKSECLVIDPVGNFDRHDVMQLASLAGFDPEVSKSGAPGGSGEEQDEDADHDQREVREVEIDGATEIVMRKPKTARYNWRETSLGWVLLIPNIGYYLVAWHGTTKRKATIRFYDQRPGRRNEPARDVLTDPIDFEMAYGLVEGEMDRFFNARDKRGMKRNRLTGGQYQDHSVREFDAREKEAPATERHQMTFVELNDGLTEELHVEEQFMLSDAKWRERPTTPKQKQLMRKMGVKAKSLPEKAGEASDLIGILMIERDAKMRVPPTAKQIAYLKLNGLPMAKTKGEASRLIWPHRKAAEEAGSSGR